MKAYMNNLLVKIGCDSKDENKNPKKIVWRKTNGTDSTFETRENFKTWFETLDDVVHFTFKFIKFEQGKLWLLDISRGMYIVIDNNEARCGYDPNSIINDDVFVYGLWEDISLKDLEKCLK